MEAGADALGFNMFEGSPRYVDSAVAADMVSRLPRGVLSVGVFVNAGRDHVAELSEQIGFDVLQFHGDEEEEFCRAFGRDFIKAIRVENDTDVGEAIKAYPAARAVLLDTRVEGLYGGTGRTFDWSQAKDIGGKAIVLAGGLHPANVGDAIAAVQPCAVDVSGGVEREKGVKDPAKIKAFVEAVRSADATIMTDEKR